MKSIEQLHAFILTSNVRKNVLKVLTKSSPLRQTEIANKLKQKQPNISPVLYALEKEKLIECLTPEKKAWKVYKISALGKEVFERFL